VQQFLIIELNVLSQKDISALVRLLSLAEQILSWDFSYYHILFSRECTTGMVFKTLTQLGTKVYSLMLFFKNN